MILTLAWNAGSPRVWVESGADDNEHTAFLGVTDDRGSRADIDAIQVGSRRFLAIVAAFLDCREAAGD